MGLFDKKYCDICGDKIGLLGNRKLENGNLCKNCAKKLFAVLVLALELRAALIDVEIAARHVRKIQNIRVGLRKISGSRHHEFPRVLVKKHFGVRAECSGRMEGRHPFPVLLPIGKLRLDLLDGAAAPVREPRRELFGTVFAEIPVF